eukprot:22077_1
MSSSKLLRFLYGRIHGCVCNGSYKHQRVMLCISHIRCYDSYEGKPLEDKQKNWAQEKLKNRFMERTASAMHRKARDKWQREMQINEEWEKQREEQKSTQNIKHFTFYSSHEDVTKNNFRTNGMKYAIIGVGIIGIGFLFIKSK